MNIELGACQMKFAELVWENAPIRSGDLVKLAEQTFGWKKSTTYTVLRVLSNKGLFKTENCTVYNVMSREQFYKAQCVKVVQDSFEGSLPAFLTAFASGKKITKQDAEAIQKLIDEYVEK